MSEYYKIQPEEDGKKPSKTSRVIIIIVLLAVVLAVVIDLIFSYVMHRRAVEEAEKAVAEEVVNIPESSILGNYDVRFDYSDSVARFVGVIDKDINDNYVLTILSDYAPRVIQLNMDSRGNIISDELGSGTMSYKQSIDKTIIRFQKETCRCTLTK